MHKQTALQILQSIRPITLVESNRVESNRVESNRVERNRVESNRVESNRVESIQYTRQNNPPKQI